MIGISVKLTIGIGDAIQFSSIPENCFRATGQMVIDETKHWIFDHNPYVIRDEKIKPLKSHSMWNFNPRYTPKDRHSFTSQMEQHCGNIGIPVSVRHPRLYFNEDYPFHKRHKILLQTHGKSHGAMPDHVIEHVLKKYKDMHLFHIGLPSDPDLGIPKIHTPTLWDLVKEVSEARMLIGMDSGPSWIAACYPDIIIKKLRTKPSLDVLKNWVPLAANNIHAIWDDLQLHSVYNVSEDDVGFTSSYRRI